MSNHSQQHGAFSWFELLTTDTTAAKAFYSQLFGWSMTDQPIQNMIYTVLSVGDQQVGGLAPIPSQSPGMPPNWGVYVTVDDVDASAKLASELGGKVLLEPRDIPDVGRFALIQDPQGASLAIITYAQR
jgi:predicted enzyme related to lactoylglutathione lyase